MNAAAACRSCGSLNFSVAPMSPQQPARAECNLRFMNSQVVVFLNVQSSGSSAAMEHFTAEKKKERGRPNYGPIQCRSFKGGKIRDRKLFARFNSLSRPLRKANHTICKISKKIISSFPSESQFILRLAAELQGDEGKLSEEKNF
jgi:hypothetical protein